MAPALQILLLVALSLVITWWAFFSRCVTIRVATKDRKIVLAGYPSMPNGSRNWHPSGVLHEEYRYFVTDIVGREWIVKAAFDLARTGQTVTLRQWVDEWRPVAQDSE